VSETRFDSRQKIFRANLLGFCERAFFALGAVCLAVYAYAQTDATVGQWAALKKIQAPAEPDQSLWNATRITDYQDSLIVQMSDPLGILRIPTLDLTVPVFKGSSELELNRGAGRIKGTAPLGSYGNAGIAGHRDGFFRVLKDIKVGDAMDVDTPSGAYRYRVTDITIVDQQDLHVLEDSFEPVLTLVTCYPFYFVGHAPQRYIVKGVLDDARPDSRT
jgi:sortase A